jgi:hypothetical protein
MAGIDAAFITILVVYTSQQAINSGAKGLRLILYPIYIALV